MHYEDFFVQIHPPQGEEHPVTVRCPAGDGRGTFRVPLTAEELRALQNCDDNVERARLEEVGSRLFESLFTDNLRGLLAESLARLPEDGEHGLRIKLCFDPEVLPIGQLPWEIVFWKERREFLNLGRRMSVVRYLNVPRGARPRLVPPLRILLASACPDGVDDLEFDTEAGRIEEALRKVPSVQVEWLQHATPQRIREKLLEAPFHVFHFMGHGKFDPRSGEGVLLLEDDERRQCRLPGRILAHLLRDFPSLQLAFLNACRTACSAREAGFDPFAGVASALILSGMPAVLAMQLSVSDDAASLFSTAFYRRIAAGDPVDAATSEGRMAVLLGEPTSSEWATPALFLRSWDGRLFEPARDSLSGVAAPEIRGEIHDFSRLIQDKTEGFVGRRWVFDAIGRFTRENPRGYFVVSGDPGIGKTALMAELVKRERFLHHFNIRQEGIQRPEQFLRNICAQLIAAYGLEPTPLPSDATQSSRFLSTLLERVSAKLGPGEKATVLVDALDETDLGLLAPGANALYLPISLPPSFYVVVSTRRGDLPLRITCEQERLEISQDSPHNLEDIREYVESYLPRSGIRAYVMSQSLDDTSFVARMVERSQGNFMYLHYVLPEIDRGDYGDRAFETLPTGLVNYYEEQWGRMRTHDKEAWLPVLAALTAVREPISIGEIARFSGLRDLQRVGEVVRLWSPFLYTERIKEEAGTVRNRYRLYHSSFFDFLVERVDLGEAHQRIAEALWEEP